MGTQFLQPSVLISIRPILVAQQTTILPLMNVFIYLRAVLRIKLGPVISAANRRMFFGGFSANRKFVFGGFMATLQNSASRLKFGGLGVYCYRATCYPSALLRSAYSIMYVGSWNAHPGLLCWARQPIVMSVHGTSALQVGNWSQN